MIMNKDFYKRKILEILQDTNFYKPTTSKCFKQTLNKIRKFIKDAEEITRHEIIKELLCLRRKFSLKHPMS